MRLEDTIFTGFTIGVSVLTIILHSYGIHLLVKTNWEKHFLIINLSCTNILLCANTITYNVLKILLIETPLYYLAGIVGFSIVVSYFVSLFLLTKERFIEVYLHLRYCNSWFDRNKIRLSVAGWILSVSYIIVMTTLWKLGFSEELIYYVIPRTNEAVWQSVLVLQFVLVYGYLYVKFQRAQRENQVLRHGLKRKNIFAPFFVVFSFIMLDTVPGVWMHFQEHEHSTNVIPLLYSLDLLCNSILYVFLRKDIREHLANKQQLLMQTNI